MPAPHRSVRAAFPHTAPRKTLHFSLKQGYICFRGGKRIKLQHVYEFSPCVASAVASPVENLKEQFPRLKPEVCNPPAVEAYSIVAVVTNKLHIDCLHNQL